MKSTGMVRAVDELGRVVIPKEIRKVFGLDKSAPIEIFATKDSIILRKYEPGCLFCMNVTDTIQYQGKTVCRECAAALRMNAEVGA